MTCRVLTPSCGDVASTGTSSSLAWPAHVEAAAKRRRWTVRDILFEDSDRHWGSVGRGEATRRWGGIYQEQQRERERQRKVVGNSAATPCKISQIVRFLTPLRDLSPSFAILANFDQLSYVKCF